MKLLLLSHTGQTSGGAEKCLIEYTEVLTSLGHTCKIIIPNEGQMTELLKTKQIPYKVICYGWATEPHRKAKANDVMTSTGSALTKLFHEVEEYNPEVIITNTSVIPWGLFAGKAFNIPTVVLVHEILNNKDPSLRMAPSYKDYGAILNEHTDFVIYNSDFVKGEFKDILTKPKSAKKILYPIPPIDKKIIDSYYRKNDIGDVLKIAIIGAISPRKNQLEAASAIKILYDQGIRDLVLDIYGDQKTDIRYTQKIKRFIKDNNLQDIVTFKGYTNDVYETLNRYNIVLSVATYEPFGRTVIEGQLFGKIVISNDTGGGLELIQHNKTGLVYRLGKPEELAKNIKWVINNKKQAITLGLNAKEEQYVKYISESRYDALSECIDYCKSLNKPKELNLYDPLLDLFQYNHYLNNKYKNWYRITHNRITYILKKILSRVKFLTKKLILRFGYPIFSK